MNAQQVFEIATRIAQCDFLTHVCAKVPSPGNPAQWIIRVSEGTWSRDLLVRDIEEEGDKVVDANLDILQKEEGEKPLEKVDPHAYRGSTHLSNLVKEGYSGVKSLLQGP